MRLILSCLFCWFLTGQSLTAQETNSEENIDLIDVASETGFVLQTNQDALIVFEPVKSGVFDITIRLTANDIDLAPDSGFVCEQFTHKRHDWVTTKCSGKELSLAERSLTKFVLADLSLTDAFTEIGISNLGKLSELNIDQTTEVKFFPQEADLNMQWVNNMASVAGACFLWYEVRNTPLPGVERKNCRDAQGERAVLKAKIEAAARIAAAKAEAAERIAAAKAEAEADYAREKRLNEVLSRWVDKTEP